MKVKHLLVSQRFSSIALKSVSERELQPLLLQQRPLLPHLLALERVDWVLVGMEFVKMVIVALNLAGVDVRPPIASMASLARVHHPLLRQHHLPLHFHHPLHLRLVQVPVAGVIAATVTVTMDCAALSGAGVDVPPITASTGSFVEDLFLLHPAPPPLLLEPVEVDLVVTVFALMGLAVLSGDGVEIPQNIVTNRME